MATFPYCPSIKCLHHTHPQDFLWKKKGFYVCPSSIRRIQRYECLSCGRSFSSRSFKLDYRHRKRGLFEKIFQGSTLGMSNRTLGHLHKLSETSVRERLKKLARQGMLHWEKKVREIRIEESVAYDGFETYVYSQYHPNHLGHAVGKNSLFLYDFSYAHLNRKGKMTQAQILKREEMYRSKKRYKGNLVEVQSSKVFRYLALKSSQPLVLHTDEHAAYPRALQGITALHQTISSRKARNAQNPLFPINHLDMKLRHFLKSCTRETIAFNKNAMGFIDRYVLFGIQKNFLRPQFLKGPRQKERPSPAMLIGATKKILNFKEFFKQRLTMHQSELRQEWKDYFFRKVEGSIIKMRSYQGAY